MQTKMIAAAVAAAWMAVSCKAEIDRPVSLDRWVYNLTSPSAQALAGGDTIPFRAESFGLSQKVLPRVVFASTGETEALARLDQGLQSVLGSELAEAEVNDEGSKLTVAMEHGFASTSKINGGLVVLRTDYPRAASTIESAGQAVDAALCRVAESGLLTLAAGETLDVTGVYSTHYAGWMENGAGGLDPVFFAVEGQEEPVTEYVSEWTVTFGRRFGGVPVLGPPLAVELDATGQMVVYIKTWREISGVDDEPIQVLSDSEIEAAKNQELASTLELKAVNCGYTEGSGISQQWPGVGCVYDYTDHEQMGTLYSPIVDIINIAAEDLPLWGESNEE